MKNLGLLLLLLTFLIGVSRASTPASAPGVNSGSPTEVAKKKSKPDGGTNDEEDYTLASAGTAEIPL